MEIDRALQFISENHHAVLATQRRDLSPQLSPVVAVPDQEGRILISSREPAFKVRNLRRTSRCWLAVFTDRFFGAWLTVGGEAEIVELPGALPLLEDYYRRLQGEHPDWAEYREAMAAERRVLIRIHADSAGPDRQG